ncbi:AMP-dependent synthetase/ligase [Tanacetum coccineum]|uniref:AMP-dependent synthetase/ligase n=1 Tax=Tanacetum coccineum TaxID=301880 RepID=A0ABQ5BJ48_9ASTR
MNNSVTIAYSFKLHFTSTSLDALKLGNVDEHQERSSKFPRTSPNFDSTCCDDCVTNGSLDQRSATNVLLRLSSDRFPRDMISSEICVHLGDFSRIIVGFYSINGLKSGKVEVHDNAVVGSQSILLPGSVVNNDVILGVLLVAPIHSVIKRGGVYMVKSRYSHRIGVNGKGVLNIYDDIKGLPNHKIFHLGTRYSVIVRHSNGLRSYDDARLNARGAVRMLSKET